MRLFGRVVAPIIALAVVVGGCVSPGETEAVVIEEVPFDLLGPASTTTTTTPIEPAGNFELELYFLAEDDSLWRVTRAREQAPGIQEALDALVAGPTDEEAENLAVRARLSESLNPVAGQPTEGLLSITVADEAQFRDDPNNRLSTQVLVCTMTQFEGLIDAVQLRDTSGSIQLSGFDSESIGDIATRSNYNDCEAGDLSDFTLDPEAVDGEPDGSATDGADGEPDPNG